jgi:hypothetical protein
MIAHFPDLVQALQKKSGGVKLILISQTSPLSEMKQRFMVRHVAPIEYNILIQSQPVFGLNCTYGETTNNSFIVLGLIRPG